jgi:hypothetical protein
MRISVRQRDVICVGIDVRQLWPLLVLLGACDYDATASAPAPIELAPRAATPSDLPTWAPLPSPDSGRQAKPTAWKADGRPMFLLFSATWCPGCTASVLQDAAIARNYGKRFQVGVALVDDSDADFARSPMATLLADVPVWNAASVKSLAERCQARAIPTACLVDKGRVLYTGSADGAARVLDAYATGSLETALGAHDKARAEVRDRVELGVTTDDDIAAIVKLTHGDAGWQNSMAWSLADRDQVSKTGAALAVALARDAVASDGGVDFAHLDTYALALSRAGRTDDAATVGERVIAVCAVVRGKCTEERRRALEFIAQRARR